jgi:hypothetical protein
LGDLQIPTTGVLWLRGGMKEQVWKPTPTRGEGGDLGYNRSPLRGIGGGGVASTSDKSVGK